MIRRQKGFTLLEMVVVIGMMGAIAVLRLQDVQTEIDQARAKKLGVEIYQYNNAVRSYVSENPNAAAGPDPAAGTEWLRDAACGGTGTRNYLPCNYPLETTLGSLEFSTTFSLDGGGFTVATTTLDPLIDNAGRLRSELTGLAALIASGGAINNSTPVFAATDATYNSDPATAVITMQAINAAENDVWLRTDGGNDMDAPIAFNDTIALTERSIVNLAFIEAENPTDIITMRAGTFVLDGQGNTSTLLTDRVMTSGATVDNLLGPSNAAAADTDASAGDIVVTDDLFVDDSVVIGEFNDFNTFDEASFGAGDLAVGGDAYVDDSLFINGVQLIAQKDVATTYGDRDRVSASDPSGDPADLEANMYWDSDDANYFVDPDQQSKFNWAWSEQQHQFGSCNLGNWGDCLDQNQIYGTEDNNISNVSKANPAVLSGFVNVDNLFVQKHFINDYDYPVDPISGVAYNNTVTPTDDKDWRWVSLQRLLPNYVHQATYVVKRSTTVTYCPNYSGDVVCSITIDSPPLVPKPVCGEVFNGSRYLETNSNRNAGVPKIVLTPIRVPVNTSFNTCVSGSCDDFARSGFKLYAESYDDALNTNRIYGGTQVVERGQSWWQIHMESEKHGDFGNAIALAQTYCYFGHRGDAEHGN